MSLDVVRLVLEQRIGAGKRTSATVRRAVLIALADRAGKDGKGIWPAQATLAAMAECSERVVRYCLADFEADGLIRRAGTHRRAVLWQIELAALKALPPLPRTRHDVPPKSGTLRRSNLARGAAQSRHFVPTNQSSEPVHEPDREPVVAGLRSCSVAGPTHASASTDPDESLTELWTGFEDVLCSERDDEQWAAYIDERVKRGYHRADIVCGMRSFFLTHRRRKATNAAWQPIRVPHHPGIIERIERMAEKRRGECAQRPIGKERDRERLPARLWMAPHGSREGG